MLLLNLHHLLQVLRLQLRIGPVVHNHRRPVRIHNLARLRRVILPVAEPLLEILRFRLILRNAIDISAAIVYIIRKGTLMYDVRRFIRSNVG